MNTTQTIRSNRRWSPNTLKAMLLTLLLYSAFSFGIVNAKEAGVRTLLVWGDSLSAAYNMPSDQGWVALLAAKLGTGWQVINGSVVGETTKGGLKRLPSALQLHQPVVLIIGLGSNDGLRGLSLKRLKANLQSMVDLAEVQNVRVLLFGHQMPPNYGAVYTKRFSNTFEAVAKLNELAYVPFFLDGVATDFSLMQADALHPRAEAQPKLLDTIWPYLVSILRK